MLAGEAAAAVTGVGVGTAGRTEAPGTTYWSSPAHQLAKPARPQRTAEAVKATMSPWWNGPEMSEGKKALPVTMAAWPAPMPVNTCGPRRVPMGL